MKKYYLAFTVIEPESDFDITKPRVYLEYSDYQCSTSHVVKSYEVILNRELYNQNKLGQIEKAQEDLMLVMRAWRYGQHNMSVLREES